MRQDNFKKVQKDLIYEHTKGCKKVSRLLHQDEKVYEGVVCFDQSSYDTEDEIPSLCIDENIVMVEEFQVDKEGSEIIITSGDNRYTLDLKSYTEQKYENMDLYKLLIDVYYETDYSWEIGDFEQSGSVK